ncbi:MAG TPA: DUF5753 domain-containing protein [Trebonia sp.]
MTDDEVSARVAARMKRQAILTRDNPPTAWFLLDEAALHRCVGSPEIMVAQMAQLTAIARLPNATIQVVPAIAHAGLGGRFASWRAPPTSKQRSPARYSRMPKLSRACLPASIRSGMKR